MDTPQSHGYGPILKDRRFEAFLWTQFLGAFNDNVYKMIVSIMALRIAAAGAGGSQYLALAGAVFVLPFLLFAGYAGQLADRFSKTRVLQITKSLEMVAMLMGIAALVTARIDLLLIVLFLLATQANFFSPAKYGFLPEIMNEANLSRANGLLELTTFIAIVIGTSFGTFLFDRWQHQPLLMGGTLLAIAIVGSLLSLHIRFVPAAGSTEQAFRWNPFHEIVAGTREILRRRTLALSVAGISWFWFIGALFQLALLLVGKETLHVPEAQVGFLVTALALGIGLGSIAAGTISGTYIELGLVPAGSALMGIFAILLGLATNYVWALVWLTGVGFCAGLFAVPLNAYLQENAPAHQKGRILATNNFANMVGVIAASGLLSLLHDVLHWNAGRIVLALGIVMLLVSVPIVALMPEVAVRFVLRCVANVLFRIRVEGPGNIPRQGAALLVCNHVSYADSVLLGLSTPRFARFVMWKPYYDLPVANFFFRVLYAIPIESTSPKTVIRALRAARGELLKGNLVAMFPEGKVTRDGATGPFERGFERILTGTGAPVIPVYIDGMYGHPLSTKGGGLLKSWERAWRPVVKVRIGEALYIPLSPEALRDIVLQLGPAAGTI